MTIISMINGCMLYTLYFKKKTTRRQTENVSLVVQYSCVYRINTRRACAHYTDIVANTVTANTPNSLQTRRKTFISAHAALRITYIV